MDSDQTEAVERWSRYAPQTFILDHGDKAEFFESAPSGTVLEIYGDLFERSTRGDWIHLEDLVSVGGYSDYREHETSTPDYMTKHIASLEYSLVKVLRLGEGSW